ERLAVELEHIADAGRDDQELADDNADERAAHGDAQARDDVGKRRGQYDIVENLALRAAERARHFDEEAVRLLGAGLDGQELGKYGRDENEDDQSQVADAEPRDEERQPGDVGYRPADENVRIEHARRGPENTEKQPHHG